MNKATVMNIDMADMPKIKEITLKSVEYKLQKKYSIKALNLANYDVDFILSNFSDFVAVELKGIVYGSKTKAEEVVYIPDGRIQHLKKAIFPKWLLKKFPLKTVPIAQKITVYNSYPDITRTSDIGEYRRYELQ